MEATPMFASAPARRGMYESFYLRAVSRDQPIGVWIRHTVDKPPGKPPRGSVWCTVFDAARGRPFMHKLTSDALSVPAGTWIEVGDPRGDEQSAAMGPPSADGACGAASWSLRIEELEPELRHLPREWLYRAPLPRTKLTSPSPLASFSGELTVAGDRSLHLEGWRGMVGHNWGAEHAERWIWLHGVGFEGAPQAWLDVALGRIRVGGRLTPWVANGMLSLDGRRIRLGGLGSRGLSVRESARGATLRLPGERGTIVELQVDVPDSTAAGWRYADPPGGERHDVVNCSIAALRLEVTLPGERTARTLASSHGGAYELGMRERDHGVPIAPFD
ncbi:MAG: hypothetical protein ACYDHT_07130 [Solirubrobacteraceae bacterium]